MSKKFPLFFAWGLLVLSSLVAAFFPDVTRSTSYSLLPIAAILSLETYKHNLRPALMLLLVAFIIGVLAEAQGLAYGTIFGGHYEYTFQSWFSIAGVPVQVGLYWAIFYYLSHVVANTLDRSRGRFKHCLLDAALMTGIDLLLDPVMVVKGVWRWFDTGPYFGIPTGNFVGWFLVSFTIAFVVRKILNIKITDKTNFALISLAAIIVLLFYMYKLV